VTNQLINGWHFYPKRKTIVNEKTKTLPRPSNAEKPSILSRIGLPVKNAAREFWVSGSKSTPFLVDYLVISGHSGCFFPELSLRLTHAIRANASLCLRLRRHTCEQISTEIDLRTPTRPLLFACQFFYLHNTEIGFTTERALTWISFHSTFPQQFSACPASNTLS
jgi:hypothetical protein